jgi:ubiquinol-cytochrome c reductase cytochrome c1 subunit|tara:strand:+ start:53 stop:652 length:600 start_codon:yes stop_codon:yes gene_type:complete
MFARIVRSSLRPQATRALATKSATKAAPKVTQNGTLELGLAGLSCVTMATLFATTEAQAESPDHIHPMEMPWGHSGIFSGYDTASIRRGYVVYKNVCAACHSLERIHYRELVGVCMSEEEAKAAAAEIDVVDGPNDIGQMFERPGKLSDALPSPYANGRFTFWTILFLIFFFFFQIFFLTVIHPCFFFFVLVVVPTNVC